jgi:hypothetical protein
MLVPNKNKHYRIAVNFESYILNIWINFIELKNTVLDTGTRFKRGVCEKNVLNKAVMFNCLANDR